MVSPLGVDAKVVSSTPSGGGRHSGLRLCAGSGCDTGFELLFGAGE